MQPFSRRTFLRNAATASAASALGSTMVSSIDAFAQTCGLFNVILHGLFVIDIGTGYVQISTPDCTQKTSYPHSYRAGSWRNNLQHFSPVRGEHEPIWPIPIVTPTIRDVPILNSDKMGKPDHRQAYLSLILPAPYAITGLRTFDKAEITYDSGYISATKFPLVTILTYNSPPPFAPIAGTPWDSMNYHVFAEPEVPMTCKQALVHGPDVVKRLWKMFSPPQPPPVPMPAKEENCIKIRDVQPRVRCVSSDEERALSELSGAPQFPEPDAVAKSTAAAVDQAPIVAVHMPTCAVFIAP